MKTWKKKNKPARLLAGCLLTLLLASPVTAANPKSLPKRIDVMWSSCAPAPDFAATDDAAGLLILYRIGIDNYHSDTEAQRLAEFAKVAQAWQERGLYCYVLTEAAPVLLRYYTRRFPPPVPLLKVPQGTFEQILGPAGAAQNVWVAAVAVGPKRQIVKVHYKSNAALDYTLLPEDLAATVDRLRMYLQNMYTGKIQNSEHLLKQEKFDELYRNFAPIESQLPLLSDSQPVRDWLAKYERQLQWTLRDMRASTTADNCAAHVAQLRQWRKEFEATRFAAQCDSLVGEIEPCVLDADRLRRFRWLVAERLAAEHRLADAYLAYLRLIGDSPHYAQRGYLTWKLQDLTMRIIEAVKNRCTTALELPDTKTQLELLLALLDGTPLRATLDTILQSKVEWRQVLEPLELPTLNGYAEEQVALLDALFPP